DGVLVVGRALRARADARELGRRHGIVRRGEDLPPRRELTRERGVSRAQGGERALHRPEAHVVGDSHRPSVLIRVSSSWSAVVNTREAASNARWYCVNATISSSSET